jgi:hypothetical protein
MFRAVKLLTRLPTNHPSPLNCLPNHVQPLTPRPPSVCCPTTFNPIGMLIISTRASDASYGSPTARRRPRHCSAVRRGLQRGGMYQQLQRRICTNLSCIAPWLSLCFVFCVVTTVRYIVHLGRQGSSVNVYVLITFHCRPRSTNHTSKYMACLCLSDV